MSNPHDLGFCCEYAAGEPYEGCGTDRCACGNYQRTTCDKCGARLCLICAYAPSDSIIACKFGCRNGQDRMEICRKKQGKAEEGNSCLLTPGTCESCPDWWNRRAVKAYPYKDLSQLRVCSGCGKKTAKRKNALPAPVCFYVGSISMSLCMKCAKKASSALDVAIEKIESGYNT